VSPATIIPAFDPFKYRKLSLLLVCKVLPVNPLYFDGLEEALSYRIIPAVTFSAHTLNNQLICLQDPGELVAGILGATVGVKDHNPLLCLLVSAYT
jgi:hypothetical protein